MGAVPLGCCLLLALFRAVCLFAPLPIGTLGVVPVGRSAVMMQSMQIATATAYVTISVFDD